MSSPELQRAGEAARHGDLDGLQACLSADNVAELLNSRDEAGDSLLTIACRAATDDMAIPRCDGTPEQHAAIDMILEAGADPAAANDEGRSPLHIAAMADHRDLATRLLAAGAPRSGRLYGCEGGSPLALALFYARSGVAEVLAQPPTPDNLRHAAALGAPLDRFFSGGHLKPEALTGLDFYRPLMLFPEWQRSFETQEVLDEALTWAARNGQIQSMELLLELGADINSNPYRGTALLWACYDDRVDAAAWLLDHGAEADLLHDFGGAGHGEGAAAIHLAAQFASLGCLQLLIDRGADYHIVDRTHGGTPEDWARVHDADDAIRLLRAAAS
jgi:ankyrin repeat protein